MECVGLTEWRDVGIGELAFPRGADERFHMIEIALQSTTAGGGNPIFRAWNTPLERLGTGHVRGILELARMNAQVAVGRSHEALELIECERLIHRERAHDSQSHPLMNQPVQCECPCFRAS